MAVQDELVAHYWSLKPLQFTELECFDLRYPFRGKGDRPTSALSIVLRPGGEAEYPKLALHFVGVAQVHLRAEMHTQLPQIEISSVRGRGWEGLHYLVHETDSDGLQFYCDSFDARIVSDPDKDPQ